VFLDTNVLIYATRPSSAFHTRVLAAIDKALREDPYLAISLSIGIES